MQAGKLQHRILIQSLTETLDSQGRRVQNWANFATVWAAVTPASGREFKAANATQSAVLTKILIRHRAGIVPTMRVLHGQDTYNIQAVLPDPSFSKHIVLMCEKGLV
jgi:SPP1 family predicted phage head-tail adaptor